VSESDRCRFCRLFAWSLLGMTAVLGACSGLLLRGSDYPLIVFVSLAVRSVPPAAVGTALLPALVLWAQALPPGRVDSDLRRILIRGAAISLPAHFVALLLLLLIGVALGIAPLSAAFASLAARHVGSGLVSTACDVVLVAFLAFRYLVRLRAFPLSLPAKLALVIGITTPARAALALLVAQFLSS
jgi:hypothetical protein